MLPSNTNLMSLDECKRLISSTVRDNGAVLHGSASGGAPKHQELVAGREGVASLRVLRARQPE
jgi:hypothetical protein